MPLSNLANLLNIPAHHKAVGDLFVEAMNAPTHSDEGEEIIHALIDRIQEACKLFPSMDEFDTVLNRTLSSLTFVAADKDIPEEKLEEYKEFATKRIGLFKGLFRSIAYPAIFTAWFDNNNIEELVDTRYIFEDTDLNIEYTNRYTAFIRLCAHLRNRTPSHCEAESFSEYEHAFVNCTMNATRLRSLAMIADNSEAY